MSQKKKNKKEIKPDKKVVVDLKHLKSLEDLKTLSKEIEKVEGEHIKGGRNTDDDPTTPAEPQWPVTTGNCD